MNLRTAVCGLLLLIPGATALAQSQNSPIQESLSVGFPGKTWQVKIDSPGFIVQSNERKPDGREYLLASDTTSGLILSVTLEATGAPADAKTCPDFLKNRVAGLANLGPTDIKSSEISSMAIIEYMVPVAAGAPVRQKNLVMCTAKDNVFIDVHLSKVQFHPSDESLFTDVLNHLRIEDRAASVSASSAGAAATKTSAEYFSEGSRYYVANDFSNAIAPYENALALEKKHREMSQNFWRVLIDNLGMAYGMTGDLQHSEATLNYGISQDPSYPMFYYNLACVAGERGNMNKAMDLLGKAFVRKANSITGEGVPDPRKDDSFVRFMSNEQFRKFADALESPRN